MALTDLLRCEVPIQLAPMGGVSVSPALAVAVARAGGHAMYPGLVHTPETLAPILDALEPPFGVNFIVPMMDRGALELASERAPYVDFFLADAGRELLAALVRGVCGWQVETAEEARAAEAAGCDVVIAKGWESGGRKGVEGPALLPLLEETLAAVSIPVIAAGGIATARGVAAMLAAGAAGVRVGTRFIASEESDAHPKWIRAVLEASAEDAVVSDAFNVGMPVPGPHRVLRSSLAAAGGRHGRVRGRDQWRPAAAVRAIAAAAGRHRDGRGDAVLRRAVGGRRARGEAGRRDRGRVARRRDA